MKAKYYMYRIKQERNKIKVVCEKCYQNGEVIKTCSKCGVKGVHNKTKNKWIIHNRLIGIDDIDRDSEGNLRYWEDMSCYFEESEKLIHFTYKDALKECRKRNKEIK